MWQNCKRKFMPFHTFCSSPHQSSSLYSYRATRTLAPTTIKIQMLLMQILPVKIATTCHMSARTLLQNTEHQQKYSTRYNKKKQCNTLQLGPTYEPCYNK